MTENKDLIELLKSFNERLINSDRGAISSSKEYRICGLSEEHSIELKNGLNYKFHIKDQIDEYFSFLRSNKDRFTIEYFHLWLN